MQADLLTKVILPLSLFLIMFGMGLSLRLTDFRSVLKFPKAILIGISGQMLLLPLAALMIAHIFKLGPELAVGLMIISLAPGGATSNMFSYLFKGDVALSITLTAMVGMITPFSIPFIVDLSMNHFMQDTSQIELPVVKTIIQLLVIAVVPVVLGMLFLNFWSKVAARIEKVLKVFSVIFMFLIIGLIILKNKEHISEFFVQTGSATLLLNIFVLSAGYFIAKWSKLSREQAITIGFEIGIQNGTLALVVAGTLIGNSTMMIPAVTYGLLMFVTGASFGWLVKHSIFKHQ
ncbi:MAG: bile acid:sodium symporter family protein [bacterium]